jgi:RimJ/RimL family protein N-acetyltransferase
MDLRAALTEIWPLYGLTITTSRLELGLPVAMEVVELARVAARGIQQPGEPHFQAAWLYEEPRQVERGLLQVIARDLANWKPDDWSLGLAAFRRLDGQPIGMQHIFSPQFARTRGFGSGIWLGIDDQGQGFGTEMGRAVLKFGFEGLDAEEAYIGAWSDNHRSIRMMEKLGYRPNGGYRQIRGDECLRDQWMIFSRDQWQATQAAEFADISISGLAECRELFGLS